MSNNMIFDCEKNLSKRSRPGLSMCFVTLSQKGNKRINSSTNNTQQSTAMRYSEYIRAVGNTKNVYVVNETLNNNNNNNNGTGIGSNISASI